MNGGLGNQGGTSRGVAKHNVDHTGGKIPWMSSTSFSEEGGMVSEGLNTTVLPAAMVGPSFHTAIIGE